MYKQGYDVHNPAYSEETARQQIENTRKDMSLDDTCDKTRNCAEEDLKD